MIRLPGLPGLPASLPLPARLRALSAPALPAMVTTLARLALLATLVPASSLTAQATAQSRAAAQTPAQAPMQVEMGAFDYGKMWTFEYPPVEHFQRTYGIDASPEWFERARMAALRIPGCSASFVSPRGLVVTNHHCARGAITSVTREGENLLDTGFHAETPADERPIPDYHADQLLAALDVTERVEGAVAAAGPGALARDAARTAAQEVIRAELQDEYGDGVLVQFVPLYNGARTSAYVMRRFTDVRLVAAVELQLGFFGGDPDNFTYPRYALDYAFYRVYGDDGEPFETEHWFRWGDGADPGEAVFLIGNPGPTNRLLTVDQLEYQRDFLVPGRAGFFAGRLQALRDAYDADPERGEELGLRNRAFSLSNSLKAYTGRLEALRDPEIMARKRAGERDLMRRVQDDPELLAEVTEVMDGIADLQRRKRTVGDEANAFYLLGNPTYGSRALLRGFQALQLEAMMGVGAPADSLEAMRRSILALEDHPEVLEEDLLRLRLDDLERYLGADDPLVRRTLGARSPEGAATVLLRTSVLSSRERLAETLERTAGGAIDPVPASDPVLALARALLPRLREQARVSGELARAEQELNAELGRLRFQVYGTDIPPDATSSPRITDGVVKGYEYNGTEAPTHTTLFGIYDRHHSHQGTSREWALPDRWLPVPDGLELATPLNFVSTADSYGGNSGSPALTRDLEIVGLNFDRNVQGLSRDFIYLPERGRNIMVDVRAIVHTLEVVYGAGRIVEELEGARGVRR